MKKAFTWLSVRVARALAATTLSALALAGCGHAPVPVEAASAQVVGTLHDTRGRWNPFLADNDMAWDAQAGEFVRRVELTATGGRHADGVYSLRFFVDHQLEEVFKADPAAPEQKLVRGEAAGKAGNVIFAVPRDGLYTIRFSPARQSYAISPPVRFLTRVESMQLNGFVHDAEGDQETIQDGRIHAAQKWDETQASHQMRANPDGSWSKTLKLSATGGHERHGVYQFLFSANGNGDWGFCAANGQAGQLLGGCGYNSRVGTIDESAVVIRVAADGLYTITVFPEAYRFSVDPPVELLNALTSFQVNGSMFAEPWRLDAPDHQMAKRPDGLWQKTVSLSPSGGEAKNGVYVLNFSLGALWALDGVGFGGRWGQTWHAVPQESNILFRVTQAGDYTITLDPSANRFAIAPPVEPMEAITSLKIVGGFAEFADDGQGGWNPADARHGMQTKDGRLFTRLLKLEQGQAYAYKFAANDAGWSWGLADYPYDGERRLAPHGDPPPLRFVAERSGPHRFAADVVSGNYSVTYVGD